MTIHLPDSPCKGRCTTYAGDTVCQSCGRTEVEVFGWIGFSEDEKARVWDRLEREGLV